MTTLQSYLRFTHIGHSFFNKTFFLNSNLVSIDVYHYHLYFTMCITLWYLFPIMSSFIAMVNSHLYVTNLQHTTPWTDPSKFKISHEHPLPHTWNWSFRYRKKTLSLLFYEQGSRVLQVHSCTQLTFNQQVPRCPSYSFDQPWKAKLQSFGLTRCYLWSMTRLCNWILC